MQNEVISDAKKRVLCLLDEGSFFEIDGFTNDGVVAGYGTVLRRPVCVFSQDSTVMSGAITYNNCDKICKVIDMAVKTGVPIIGFYDSLGTKIDQGAKVFLGLQKVLSKLANASGVIPQISVVSGSVTGIATFAVSFSDFVFMVENKSKMFINGPQILTAKAGMDISDEKIGGANTHYEATGSCQVICKDEKDCLDKVKELLGFLPDNNFADSDIIEKDDDNRLCEGFLSENITVEEIIRGIGDENKFFEINAGIAKNIIIGFFRVGGRVCGVVANNTLVNEGKLDIAGIDKATKFVRFCDSFNIPIVTLINNDGFTVSFDEEQNGLVRKSGSLLFAYSDATVPKVNVIFGKAFGGAGLMMGTAADIVMAWENAQISVVNPLAAVNVLYSEEIVNAESPVEFRENKLKEYMKENTLPEKSEGFINTIISPAETRQRIISALDMLSAKREIKSVRKHESITF